MIIDVHPHIISDNTEKYPITPLGNKRSKWSEERGSLTAEKLIEAMKEAGVDKAVTVHSTTTYGYNCDYVADSAAQHPDILRGVGCVDFLADDAVEKLTYWTKDRGLIGIRLFSGGHTSSEEATWVIDPKTFPAWKWAQETKTPIVLQWRGTSLRILRQLMDKFDGLTLLLDHASSPTLEDGYPFEALKPLMELADYPGLNLKVTTVNMKKEANKLAEGNYNVEFKADSYTEINDLASTLDDATEKLSKVDELRKDLVANVSHDIKTPLTVKGN